MEGKPMYVESLMTVNEMSECSRKYTTYNNGGKKQAPLPDTEQKWRYKMGSSFTKEEIALWNKNLNLLLNSLKKLETK